MNTIEKLDRYAETRSHLDLLRIDYEAKRAEIMATVQQQLNDLEAEYQPKIDAGNENLQKLEAEIKADTLAGGLTVKGRFFQAVYTKGRISWDTKALDGFATAHPEILPFRKEGEPSISLRAIGKS